MLDSKDLRKEAFEMFQQGFKLVDIAKQLNVPAGTVRRWKHSDKWEKTNVQEPNVESERSEQEKEQARDCRDSAGCTRGKARNY